MSFLLCTEIEDTIQIYPPRKTLAIRQDNKTRQSCHQNILIRAIHSTFVFPNVDCPQHALVFNLRKPLNNIICDLQTLPLATLYIKM